MEQHSIYTIGYAHHTVESLLALLSAHHIELLVDVRSSPYSRYKPEFSRDALERTLRQTQQSKAIAYLYMGDALGGRHDGQARTTQNKSYVNYDAVKSMTVFQEGIERLRTLWEQGKRLCLLCSEARPEHCHRATLIGDVLVEQLGISVLHFDRDEEGNNTLISHQEAMERLLYPDPKQNSLFEQSGIKPRIFHNRKPIHTHINSTPPPLQGDDQFKPL